MAQNALKEHFRYVLECHNLMMFASEELLDDLTAASLNATRPVKGASSTSRKAAEFVEPRAGSQRHRIMALLDHGMRSAESIADALSMNPSSVRPRLKELEQHGIVARDNEVEVPTASGAVANPYYLTTKGAAVLIRMNR